MQTEYNNAEVYILVSLYARRFGLAGGVWGFLRARQSSLFLSMQQQIYFS